MSVTFVVLDPRKMTTAEMVKRMREVREQARAKDETAKPKPEAAKLENDVGKK